MSGVDNCYSESCGNMDINIVSLEPNEISTTVNDDESKLEKPKISYVALITMALQTRADGRMTVSEIYKYFEEKYQYFRDSDKKGWQNSVRHNLSLNDCFVKIPRDGVTSAVEKKGNYWALAVGYEDMFPDGNFKRRRRMRRPVKPFTEVPNPFGLLDQQTYCENLYNQPCNDCNRFYVQAMPPMIGQFQPPPYSAQHQYNSQSAFTSTVNYTYQNVVQNPQQVTNFCVFGSFGSPSTSKLENVGYSSNTGSPVAF